MRENCTYGLKRGQAGVNHPCRSTLLDKSSSLRSWRLGVLAVKSLTQRARRHEGAKKKKRCVLGDSAWRAWRETFFSRGGRKEEKKRKDFYHTIAATRL